MAGFIRHAALSISRPQSPRNRDGRNVQHDYSLELWASVILILMLSYCSGPWTLRIATLEMISRPRNLNETVVIMIVVAPSAQSREDPLYLFPLFFG